jgi:hypothetical protein
VVLVELASVRMSAEGCQRCSQSVSSGNIKHVVLGPPYEIPAPAAIYCLLNDKLAALSVQWFGTDSTWYGKPAPANTCP